MHRKNPNRKFSLRFGKEEMSTEDKKPCLQGFVPSWSFLTRLRRPYLFPCAGKDRGEKGARLRLVLPASEFRREPIFQASFHTIVTSRVSDYAPPDTGVSDLQLVALEQLPSIEGAVWICQAAPFCGEVFRICTHPMPSPGMRINSRNRKKDDKRRKKRDSKV